MANKRIVFELDEAAHEALDALKEKLGTTDIAAAIRASLGGYSALLQYLAENPDAVLALVNRKGGEWRELVLHFEGSPVFPPRDAMIPLSPQEESDKEVT